LGHSPGGGIGRHKGLKIPRRKLRDGSSPSLGTKGIENMNSSENIENEIDYLNLSYLLGLIRSYFKQLLLIVVSCGAISVFYALSLSNFYTSVAKFAPASNAQESSSTLGGFSGMTAGLGINLGNSNSNRMNFALEILNSTDFFKTIYKNEQFLIELAAIEEYDPVSKEIVIDDEIYDSVNSKWLTDNESYTKTKQPSLLEAKERFFGDHISSSVDLETDFITISITHSSPYVAKAWLDFISSSLDEYIQSMEIVDIKQSINYLNSQLTESNSNEVRRALSSILEQQMKTLMLSEVNSGYVIKIIDSPSFPEKKSGPGRAKICIVLTFLGSLFGYLFILIWDLNKNRKFLT
tara:strand:+ start:9946 stop:10998 length:1053 start_codon:yes stop_codon:yes gene_type:complete